MSPGSLFGGYPLIQYNPHAPGKKCRACAASFNNRHCPKCGNAHATEWLQRQEHLLLPCTYFLVTFTIPSQLHQFARSNQKLFYHLLFRCSGDAC